MKKQSLLLILSTLFYSTLVLAQSSADYWKKGFAAYQEHKFEEAIHLLKIYDEMSPKKPTAQRYLALSYDRLWKLDSAIYFYEKALEYQTNTRPDETSLFNLGRAYLRNQDYSNAYTRGFHNMATFPDKDIFYNEFEEICLWSYLIKYQNLNSEYLTEWFFRDNYIVNTSVEQRVVVNNIRDENNEALLLDTRRNKGMAERWYGNFPGDKEIKTILFLFTDKDFEARHERQIEQAHKILHNPENSMMDRIGALYVSAPLDNKELADVLEYEDLHLRYCACREIRSEHPNKLKKICRNDTREQIQTVVENNPAFR